MARRGQRRKLRTRIYYEELVAGKGFCSGAKKNKIRFLSEGAAHGAIPFIHYLHPEVKPFYAYFCSYCRIWHLATDKDKLPLQEDIPLAA